MGREHCHCWDAKGVYVGNGFAVSPNDDGVQFTSSDLAPALALLEAAGKLDALLQRPTVPVLAGCWTVPEVKPND